MTAQSQRGEGDAKEVAKAEFQILGPGSKGDPIKVHFNPESLEYTVSNNIKEQGNSPKNKQQISRATGKLSFELIFDTSLSGDDVRSLTDQLRAMMKPHKDGGKQIAPIVEFRWGTYRFTGVFSSYKESLDFFASTGVPLRATVSVTMAQQDGVFDPSAKKSDGQYNDNEAFSPTGGEAGDSPFDQRGPATGDPETDRNLAEDNDEDNPRFFSGKELELPSGPNLQPPAAFAASRSLGAPGFGAGGGFGVDVGFSGGVSAGVGIGLGIEAGLDVGLSVGFDFDIGVDVSIEAELNAEASAGLGIGGTTSSSGFPRPGQSAIGGAVAVGASGSVGVGGSVGVTTGDSTTGGFVSAGSEVFAQGAFIRRQGGPALRSGEPRVPSVFVDHDDLLDELPHGPRFGGPASAGQPAALGAFAGLRPVPPRRRRPISLASLEGRRPERELRTDTGANFEIGGQALNTSPNGLGADVGARANFSDRITFDDSNGGS